MTRRSFRRSPSMGAYVLPRSSSSESSSACSSSSRRVDSCCSGANSRKMWLADSQSSRVNTDCSCIFCFSIVAAERGTAAATGNECLFVFRDVSRPADPTLVSADGMLIVLVFGPSTCAFRSLLNQRARERQSQQVSREKAITKSLLSYAPAFEPIDDVSLSQSITTHQNFSTHFPFPSYRCLTCPCYDSVGCCKAVGKKIRRVYHQCTRKRIIVGTI